MEKRVTIYDIAKAVDVSVATVSRVLSNSSYPVSPELKRKIKAAAKELGYRPNMIGRQLKTNNSMTIGVIIPSISNPFYANVVLGIEEIARRSGYHVLLCNSQHSPELEAEYLQTLFDKQVKGIIISSISEQKDLINEYISKGLIVISIDQTIDNPDVYQIGFDYKKGGYLATKYLIENGHRKIAYVTAPMNRPSRHDIFKGYQEALLESGITLQEGWLQESALDDIEYQGNAYEFRNGRELVRKLLDLDDRPTAILACNDLTALGIINELHFQGVEVPNQISVIGFDNIELSQMVVPSLTTIDHPKLEMGRFACNLLLDMVNSKPIALKEIILQPKLIIRNSTSRN
ncbi:LacI family DNA-binding transcriptional regulator [Paenibacillus filicis]|uniref:LacI family DNA-binding transcriptional regulator n=1 Tax=Paenibacillus gyeongsangnamensis TaxID=3388067 RepID=A0ABT4Q5L0_9BACL|nr:LacI family DNA-binding transcriptional regulator [Paenibacillus filicis]MCZ8512169.1 LacI family DNA-binding transcriptional regulator [Paenibacillus filicis]